MWGEPKQYGKQEEQQATEDENKETWFPLAYVFSNLQVEPAAHLAR